MERAVAIYSRKSVEREGSISISTQIEFCRAMIKPDERLQKVLTSDTKYGILSL